VRKLTHSPEDCSLLMLRLLPTGELRSGWAREEKQRHQGLPMEDVVPMSGLATRRPRSLAVAVEEKKG
jgi:hypothetical protein